MDEGRKTHRPSSLVFRPSVPDCPRLPPNKILPLDQSYLLKHIRKFPGLRGHILHGELPDTLPNKSWIISPGHKASSQNAGYATVGLLNNDGIHRPYGHTSRLWPSLPPFFRPSPAPLSHLRAF